MQRALDLASEGLGYVSPNPMVGCVIVHNDQIIGEGFHEKFGCPHAEVNAINIVQNKDLLRQSTVYVSLEPCSHHGKTPPCADLLVTMEVERVVVGMEDPNPKVSGRGIQRLRDAGISVQTNVLKERCMELNQRFIVNQVKKRPYVILKWAQTSDGYIARSDGSSKWISSRESRRLVHKWRAEEDSILVGAATAIIDDPQLNVRDWHGKDPLRVILDRQGKLPADLKVFTDGKPSICYTEKTNQETSSVQWIGLGKNYSVESVLAHLHSKGIGSLIVEGGSKTLQRFISTGLWDEARIFTSDSVFGEGIPAPPMPSGRFAEQYQYTDRLQIYIN